MRIYRGRQRLNTGLSRTEPAILSNNEMIAKFSRIERILDAEIQRCQMIISRYGSCCNGLFLNGIGDSIRSSNVLPVWSIFEGWPLRESVHSDDARPARDRLSLLNRLKMKLNDGTASGGKALLHGFILFVPMVRHWIKGTRESAVAEREQVNAASFIHQLEGQESRLYKRLFQELQSELKDLVSAEFPRDHEFRQFQSALCDALSHESPHAIEGANSLAFS
jgi:hypothetical protein